MKCLWCGGMIGIEGRCIYCGRSTDMEYEKALPKIQAKANKNWFSWGMACGKKATKIEEHKLRLMKVDGRWRQM